MPDLVRVGQRLPSLMVRTVMDVPITVNRYLEAHATLLNFLHGTWCLDCVRLLYRLQRLKPEINATGAEIVVVMRDKPEALAAFLLSARPSLKYTVLVDPTGLAHQQVGAGGHTLDLLRN